MSWLSWLGQWEADPSVWVACGLALLGYPLLPGTRRGLKSLAWALGVLVTLIALESALDIVGDRYLFSVHMVQHLVLAMVAPPLLILGLPDATVDAVLHSRVAPALRFLVQPLFAASAYLAVLTIWHVPALFDFALTHELIHVLQHLSFLGVGLIFWWAVVLHRPDEPWNLGPLGEVAYLTAGALPAVVVGLTVALLPAPVYHFYLHRTESLGISPLGDQHLGGLLMFGFDNVLMVAVAGYYLWGMFPADGSDERNQDRPAPNSAEPVHIAVGPKE
ncbi:MAG: cytochrome c oxidase assembly protein [Candidatus Dormibacteria bacterium]